MFPRQTAPEKRRFAWARPLAAALCVCAALLPVLLFVPASVAAETAAAPELGRRFAQEAHNRLGAALEEFTYVKKHYRIPTGSLPARPGESGFGASRDSEEILAVIQGASELLGEETVVAWTPETVLRPDSYVHYYYDETILVLVWQELSDDRICTWCEVKLSDPSQLRRKLAGDTYGWPIQMTASELAAEDNAVAAVSGDFYAFRTCGIHVYQGALRSVAGDMADTLFVTADGDMFPVRQWQINTWSQAWSFLNGRDIAFSLAFGPVLVENGKNVTPWDYTWGEIQEAYARAAIGQVGRLHYVFVAANCNQYGGHRFLATEVADMMIAHGCPMAYNLDGGQTAEVILGGAVMNRPEFGYERQVSDVLCFASALPGGGGA